MKWACSNFKNVSKGQTNHTARLVLLIQKRSVNFVDSEVSAPAMIAYRDLAALCGVLTPQVQRVMSEQTVYNAVVAAKIFVGLYHIPIHWDARDAVQVYASYLKCSLKFTTLLSEVFYFVWGRILRDYVTLQVQLWNDRARQFQKAREIQSSETEILERLRNEEARDLAFSLQAELEGCAEPLPFNWEMNEHIRNKIEKCWTSSNNIPITLDTAWNLFPVLEKETKDLLSGVGWLADPRTNSVEEEELLDSVIAIGRKIELEGD